MEDTSGPSVSAAIPGTLRGAKQLRACLLCSLIQSPLDFRRNGCPNCEDVMQMKNSTERVRACTTTYYDGCIAVIQPEVSWVAKWQRTSKYVRGIYAIRVRGRVPEDVEQELESRGIKYRPRDQNDQD